LLRLLGSDNSHTRSVFGFFDMVVCARNEKYWPTGDCEDQVVQVVS